MVNFTLRRWNLIPSFRSAIGRRLSAIQLTYQSLFYNQFMSQSYLADTLMEPMFWFVDNFTKFLGPFFVAAVCALTSFVVGVAYILGLPYWWERNPWFTCVLLAIGHWLLVNICFHFYMGCVTSPGYPPQDTLITEAVSICKKCISPKPPRTHHCSICDRCVLKMDHHCRIMFHAENISFSLEVISQKSSAWLNNCVGHRNHRYFFLYMAFMVLGCFYLMVFGVELAYQVVFTEMLELEELEIVGHPVRFNHSKMIPVQEVMKNGSLHPLPVPLSDPPKERNWPRTCLIFTALIVVGVSVALGSLTIWHARLIGRGETSIEAHINASETKRLSAQGKVYENPYNFGRKINWKVFLGLTNGRGWRHVLLPSRHLPDTNGMTWATLASLEEFEIAAVKAK